jgi:hypothetical protein
MNFWAALLQHIEKNWVAIEATGGVLFVAFVSVMPKNPPSSLAEYWQWVREGLQTAIPAARPRQETHTETTVVTPTSTAKQEASSSSALPLQAQAPPQPKQ